MFPSVIRLSGPSPALAVLLLAFAALVGGCSSAPEQNVDAATTRGTAQSEASVRQPSTLNASTVDEGAAQDEADAAEVAGTTVATSGSSSAETTANSSTTAASSAPETTASTVASKVFVLEGDGAFTSPSGNIACRMNDLVGVSCWIGKKDWTIDKPEGPECDEFDYGNAVDVTTDGVVYPCYSDFGWDPSADALAYGDRMQVGGYSCLSEQRGVSCTNDAGQGFRLARAAVVIL